MNEERYLELLQQLLAKQDFMQSAFKEFQACTHHKERCQWCLAKIKRHIGSLTIRFPDREETFAEVVKRLDWYTNLTFRSSKDLATLDSYLSLILDNFVALDQNGATPDTYWRSIREVYEMLDELRTLEEGDPPGERSAARASLRDLQPELRDQAREAIRIRAQKRIEIAWKTSWDGDHK